MAEENHIVSPENTEEGLAQGPAETRIHPREIMGDALPKPQTSTRTVPSDDQSQPTKLQPTTVGQPSLLAPKSPSLIEPISERVLLMEILSGISAADAQQKLTDARRRSGVGKARDMTDRMTAVAKKALSTN